MFNKAIVLAPKQITTSIQHFCEDRSTLQVPFSDSSVSFVDMLSKALLQNPLSKKHPEMVALGYWLRKANIQRLRKDALESSTQIRLSRGLVFHVAPSNVDTIFIYSLVISLLMGNKNIVRISSKPSPQKDLIVQILNQILEDVDGSEASKNLLIVSYGHDEELSKYFSSVADVRMLWGGDSTVLYFSSLPIRPTAIDIKFANKYSLALLRNDSLQLLDNAGWKNLVKDFVNDSYIFAQQACSSPRSVIWVGQNNQLIKQRFWQEIASYVATFEHGLTDSNYVDKMSYICSHSSEFSSKLSSYSHGGLLTIIDVSSENIIDEKNHCGAGTFLQTSVNSLNDISETLSRSVQTVTHFGFSTEDLTQWVMTGINGVDRIVPIGQGLNFDYIWDGVNLFESLSRIISIKNK